MDQERDLPKFEDTEAELEIYGFSSHGYNRIGVGKPGATWETGNMFDGLMLPNCNMDDAVFNDTVWKFGEPDRLSLHDRPENKVLGEIFYNDAVRRLQAIEQLTLPPEYSTVPNTAAFSRFEHVWGSALFVRQVADRYGISNQETVKLQLRTLLSDVAHTFGSHLGDWMFQGAGGTEDQHDQELMDYLETVGINDILRSNDIEPESVVFPDTVDWIEAPQPDLCVDRVDYGLREMKRWNDTIYVSLFKSDDFVLTPENMLAMADQQQARLFSEAFLLLSQENWSEPTHRFMLDMLILRTKLFYGEGRAPRSWVFNQAGLMDLGEIHPRDLMYVTDPAQTEAYALPNLGGHILEAVMKSVSQYRRQYVWPGRRQRINSYMNQFRERDLYDELLKSGSYDSLESDKFNLYLDEYPKALPVGFAILDAHEAEATKNDFSIDIPQTPLKVRQIDPLVLAKGSFKRLSELDSSYAQRLEEHRETLRQPKVARLAIADPKTLDILKAIIENTEHHWQERLKNSRRMTPEELKSLVATSSREIHGQYPFMDFLEF